MLKVEGLQIRQVGFELQADFTVPRGARVAVLGPSGAGKSTLLLALAGFVELAAGRISYEGAEIGGQAAGARPISMLFQDSNLFPHLDAFDNLALGLVQNLRPSAAQKDQICAALARVGLAGKEHRKPAELSGGEQSRVALARVLLRARPLLLLDEPFAALGPALKADMLDLVAEILDVSGASLLMVTHDPEDARRLCPLTMVVAEGQVLPPTATVPLLDDPPAALAAYLGRRA